MACLFLASKAEEMPIKIRDIVYLYYKLKRPFEPATEMVVLYCLYLCFILTVFVSQESKDMQRNVLLAERILLQTLNFDLNVAHPMLYCLMKLREFKSEW